MIEIQNRYTFTSEFIKMIDLMCTLFLCDEIVIGFVSKGWSKTEMEIKGLGDRIRTLFVCDLFH